MQLEGKAENCLIEDIYADLKRGSGRDSESKPEGGETMIQYVARLRRYFNRWTEMANCEQTFVWLRDLLHRDGTVFKRDSSEDSSGGSLASRTVY